MRFKRYYSAKQYRDKTCITAKCCGRSYHKTWIKFFKDGVCHNCQAKEINA